jgi:IS30 family transposase
MIVRRRMDPHELSVLWSRWRAGDSLVEIGRVLERQVGTLWHQVQLVGGIPPRARTRRHSALTGAEREDISRGLARDESYRCIAERLGRAPSTICREVANNGGREAYRAAEAEQRAIVQASRPKVCKLAQHRNLRRVVAYKLTQDWSPRQIAEWLKLRYPEDLRMRIHHETVYRTLFIQARGVFKKELRAHLRTRRLTRRAKNARKNPRPGIVDAISIRERPAEVEDRAVPGHWEGDLIVGANFSYIATLVERASRFVMLVKLENKETETVVSALKKHILKLPTELRKTLTWDRGMELANHKEFTVATDVAVYFCDPASPWQKGSNENTNGLLRQYFRPGVDLRDFSQAELNKIADRLNGRPRETLAFRNPAETLNAMLQ